MAETEVYRLLSPNYNDRCNQPNKCFDTNKCYSTAVYTRRTGNWPNTRYYTTNPLQYVGQYVRTDYLGQGDGGRVWEVFMNNMQQEERVELNYEGSTCFIETPCRGPATGIGSIGAGAGAGVIAGAGTGGKRNKRNKRNKHKTHKRRKMNKKTRKI